MKTKRPPKPVRIASGNTIFQLELARSKGFVLMDVSDYNRLHGMGHGMNAYLVKKKRGAAYVRVLGLDRKPKMLARLVARAKIHEHIHYRDGNTLNLTSANLVIAVRGSMIREGCHRCFPKAR